MRPVRAGALTPLVPSRCAVELIVHPLRGEASRSMAPHHGGAWASAHGRLSSAGTGAWFTLFPGQASDSCERQDIAGGEWERARVSDLMHPLFGIPVGLALSAAAGLRIFVPLLLTGVAARLGVLPLTPGMAWIGSDVALVAFTTATILEIVAYYVPWLDNFLDTIATPAAVTAGVMVTAAATPELPPFLRWTLAVVAGGGTAGIVQAGTALLRLKSSAFTGGTGNPLIATGELAGSIVLSFID